ncbi:MAG: hypothetical protein M3273_01690 [Actinomycetota bacterium]|nr:hypothetical protein [Actinomycetota bacterium]
MDAVELAVMAVGMVLSGVVGAKIWHDKGGEKTKGFFLGSLLSAFGLVYLAFATPPPPPPSKADRISEGDVVELRRTIRKGLTLLRRGEKARVVGRRKRGTVLLQPLDRELRRPAEAWPRELHIPRAATTHTEL